MVSLELSEEVGCEREGFKKWRFWDWAADQRSPIIERLLLERLCEEVGLSRTYWYDLERELTLGFSLKRTKVQGIGPGIGEGGIKIISNPAIECNQEPTL